jgi:membrane protein required for beta-lactamase induction
MTTNTPCTNSATFEVRANNRAVPIDVVAASFAEGLERELNASKAEVERLKTVKDYWANLWADLSHAAISDNVRLEKRAEKSEAEVERLRAIIDAMNLAVQALLNPTEK